MDVDVHGPGIDARGATFAGVSLYVLLGRGRDYAWSATSAGQDIIDTFAVPLCEPDGSSSDDRLDALPLPRPVPADRRAREDEQLDAEPGRRHAARLGDAPRRAHAARPGRRRGRPSAAGRCVYTKLRSTYFHEADSALGFVELNDPRKIRGPQDFQRAASQDRLHLQLVLRRTTRTSRYFNSGNNPVRAKRTSTHFPVSSAFAWRDWNTDLWTARYTRSGSRTRRRSTRRFFANWNNKQARGYRAADDNFGYGSIYRSQSLSDRIRRGIRGAREDVDHRADRRDGERRHGRPARDEGAAVRAPHARQAARPADAPRRRHAARMGEGGRPPARPRPQRRLRALGGGLDPRPLVAEVAARPVPAHARRGRVQAAAGPARARTTTRTSTASTTAPPTRSAGTTTRRRTCAACSAGGCAGSSRASTAAGRGSGQGNAAQVPVAAAGVAEAGAERRTRRSSTRTRSARTTRCRRASGATTRCASARSARSTSR